MTPDPVVLDDLDPADVPSKGEEALKWFNDQMTSRIFPPFVPQLQRHVDPYKGSTGEVRVVDPNTGGAKGSKLARMDLLPGDALIAVAEHFGKGAAKYEDRNWEKGYAWHLSFAAMQRHAWAYWQGEDIDEETGDLHIQAVAWHALVLLAFALRGAGTDDRPQSSAVH